MASPRDPHSLFLVNQFAEKDGECLLAWHGDLTTATVGDLHVWMANQRKFRSFNLLARRSIGTRLIPVYQGAWTQTLANAGVVNETVLFLSSAKDQLPCAAYALATFVAPTTQFELHVVHSLQATILDDAMVVWAPATIKTAATIIKTRDGAAPWRARVTRMLAQHVAAIHEGLAGAFASLKAVKALLKLWSVLGVPTEAVEAAHALTVLVSTSEANATLLGHRELGAFDAGAAIPALVELVQASAATLDDPMAAALVQLAAVAARTTKHGAVAPGFLFAVSADVMLTLGALFHQPFAIAAGIEWRAHIRKQSATSTDTDTGMDADAARYLQGLLGDGDFSLLAALRMAARR